MKAYSKSEYEKVVKDGNPEVVFSMMTLQNRFRLGLDGSAYQKYQNSYGARIGEVPLKNLDNVSFLVWRSIVGDYYVDETCIPTLLHAVRNGMKNIGIYVLTPPWSNSENTVFAVEKFLERMSVEMGNDFVMPLIFGDTEQAVSYKNVQVKRKKWSRNSKGKLVKKVVTEWQRVVDRQYKPSEISQSAGRVYEGLDKLQGRLTPFYSYPAFVNEHMAGLRSLKEPEWLSGRLFWGASYAYTPQDSMTLEKPGWKYMSRLRWGDQNHPLNGADVHQFSGDNNGLGSFFGGDSDSFDLNRTHFTDEEIYVWFNGKSGEVKPPEDESDVITIEGDDDINISIELKVTLEDSLEDIESAGNKIRDIIENVSSSI